MTMPVETLRAVATVAMLTFVNTSAIADSAPTQNVVIEAPNPSSQTCTEADFGAVQIRIGLHATLAACFRDVEMNGDLGTAFVTVPREFEGRTLSVKEFETFQEEIRVTEEGFRIRANQDDSSDTSGTRRDSDRRQATEPVALGVFDFSKDRVGYAYAYAINEVDTQGVYRVQPMMRTESFVLVNGRVILLMLIAPVNDGVGATETFNLSEAWARRIVSASAASKASSIASVRKRSN
jgi:hypothetical protein